MPRTAARTAKPLMTTTLVADIAPLNKVGELLQVTEVNLTDASFAVFFLQEVASSAADSGPC
jgi:hypothetical protein